MRPPSPLRGGLDHRAFPRRGLLLLALLMGPGSPLAAQGVAAPPQEGPSPVAPLRWVTTDMAVSTPAQPWRHIDAVGRRAALIGTSGGHLEAWVWPLKIVHDLHLRVLLPDLTDPIDLAERAERVEVTPWSTTLVYTHSSFTLRETLVVPLTAPGALILLEVEALRPLTLQVRFVPDLIPMWPAGLGGQYTYWDDEMKAFLLSESTRAFNAFIGCPLGGRPSSPPAHALPNTPTQFEISVDPGTARGRMIPLAIAGGVEGREAVRAAYRDLLGRLQPLYDETVGHYVRLDTATVRVRTPDPDLDRAYRWAKVAVDKHHACNPHLGCGLLAGIGPSGMSARPGFAWYFGGDTMLASLALTAEGDFATAREGLDLLRRNQRRDGKIMHELSQGAGLIPWFEKYPYGYYHAETSPYYLIAMERLYRASGDREYLREAWPSIVGAYRYCLSTDRDRNGLMENSSAGLAAVEVGSLLQELHEDVYLAGLWVEGLRSFAALADARGERGLAGEARRVEAKARRTLDEQFWSEEKGYHIFATLEGGGRVEECTIWPAIPMDFGLLDPSRAARTLARLSSAEISTDWGTRMLSRRSALYDPLHYNGGTVWPFLTGYVAWAQYRYHRPLAGYDNLRALAHLTTLDCPGALPELLSGEVLSPHVEAVPRQMFSSAMLITPLLRGLLGLEVDAPGRRITLAPHLPAAWDHVEVRGIAAGRARFDAILERGREGICLELRSNAEGRGFEITFSPAIPLGSRLLRAEVDGKPANGETLEETADRHARITFPAAATTAAELAFSPGIEVFVPAEAPRPGDRSAWLRVTDTRLEGETLTLQCEGSEGRLYPLELLTPLELSGLTGGEWGLHSGDLHEVLLVFPASSPVGEYLSQTIQVKVDLPPPPSP